MKAKTLPFLVGLGVALALFPSGCATDPGANPLSENAARLNADATAGLQNLYANIAVAQQLGAKARAILIFPDVVKGGFLYGAETGNGVMRQNGRTTGYYNLTAASYGLQAGIQTFGYAMFLMNDAALKYMNETGGWEIGLGPSVVVVDEGMARTLTTSTLRHDVYAFVFHQSGIMAGAGLQGSKITRIQP